MNADGSKRNDSAMHALWVAFLATTVVVAAGRYLGILVTPLALGLMVPAVALLLLGLVGARGNRFAYLCYFVTFVVIAVACGAYAVLYFSDKDGLGVDVAITGWIAAALATYLVHGFALRAFLKAGDSMRAWLGATAIGARALMTLGAFAIGAGVIVAAKWTTDGAFFDRDRNGVVDASGAERLPPTYAMITRTQAKSGVAMTLQDGKWGLLDREAREIVPPRYASLSIRDAQGVAVVQLDGKWGVIDLKGNTVIEPKYEAFSFVDASFAWVKLGGKWGAVDATGKVLMEPRFADRKTTVWGDVALVSGAGRRWHFVDRSGKPLGEGDFASVREGTGKGFEESGLVAATPDGKKWGFADRTGTFVVEPKFDSAYGFAPGGLARVMVGGKWGFVDRAGNAVVPPGFDGAEAIFGNGLAPVKTGTQWGLVDRAGKMVVEPRYDEVRDAGHGLVSVKTGGKWGAVDAAGAVVIQPRYTSRLQFRASGLSRAQLGSARVGVIDTKERVVLEPKYHYVFWREVEGEPMLFLVEHAGQRSSVHDAAGKQLVPPSADIDGIFDRTGDRLLLTSVVRRWCTLGGAVCLP